MTTTQTTSGNRLLAQYRSCWRKKIYIDEDAAKRGARQAKNKYDSKQRPYPCPYGPHWHLATVRDG